MAVDENGSTEVQTAQGTQTRPHKPAAGPWLSAAGAALSLVTLLWLCLMIGRFWGNPSAVPSVPFALVLALLFQVGFILCACGLAAIKPHCLYLYLPVIFVCLAVVGLCTGFIGYLAMSSPDLAYLKPKQPGYGWDLDNVSSGLTRCSLRYTRTASMGPRPMKSTLTISVLRRRTPPMTDGIWGEFIASVESEPKPSQDGPVRQTNRSSQVITIAGQRGYKVVEDMMGDRGMSFSRARYWWYSPRLARQVTCAVFIEGGGSWQLGDVEKMLNSIPAK